MEEFVQRSNIQRGDRRQKAFIVLTILLMLIAVEGALRALEHTRVGAGKFHLLPAAAYEHIYFFHMPARARLYYSRGPYDPLLGWRNTSRPELRHGGKKDTLNSDGWRAQHEYTPNKNASNRIILVGDSFSYGFMVDDSETIDAILSRRLGSGTEIYSMAAPAYGTDQMALVATRIASGYNPDTIIVAFIADDLTRSCTGFNFNLPKPYFELGRAGLELRGVPVRRPEAVLAEHSGTAAHFWDGFTATAVRSRTLDLMGQLVLQRKRRECIDELNPAIFRYIRDGVKPGVRLIFVHLDGVLPPGFETKLQSIPAEYVSLPPMVQRLSAYTGIPMDRLPDGGHPNRGLIRLYALALEEVLRRGPVR